MPMVAQATILVVPANKGGNPFNGTTAFYTTTNAAGSESGLDSNKYFFDSDPSFPFGIVDISKKQGDESGLASALSFTITSDKTSFATTSLPVIMIQANGSAASPNNLKYVPIAGVNGSPCDTNICGAQLGVNNHFFGVVYSAGQTVSIQVYPKDICIDYNIQAGAGSATGCTVGGTDVSPNQGTPTVQPMQLTFQVNSVTNDGSKTKTTEASQDSSSPISLAFQTDGPTFSCNLVKNDVYTPRDASIKLNAAFLGVAQASGRAPLSIAIVVANRGATVNLTSTYQGQNELVRRVGIADGQIVDGFVNSESLTDANSYTMGFLARDASGVVTTEAACQLSNVRTAAIQGFLSKSNCFIATAAFRSVDAAPVEMLREFRGEFLMSNRPGRAFVRWYYRWSPPAAEWLMLHPVARYPVLHALIPLQLFAWLALHPSALVLVFVLSLVYVRLLIALRSLPEASAARNGGRG